MKTLRIGGSLAALCALAITMIFTWSTGPKTADGAIATAGQMSEAVEQRPLLVAMVLWRGETESEKAFRAAIQARHGGAVKFETYNAGQSAEELEEIISCIDTSRFNLIYTFGTTATKMALLRLKGAPIVFNAVARPLEAGIIHSWTHSGKNATGVSSAVDMTTVYGYLERLASFGRQGHLKIGFIYNPDEENSRIQREELDEARIFYGFDVAVAEIGGDKSVESAVSAMSEAGVDLVILPDDSTVASLATPLVAALTERKIATVAIIPSLAEKNGAMIGVGPDYGDLGRIAAGMALSIFDGVRPTDIASERPKEITKVLNLTTAQAVGVTLPDTAMEGVRVVR